MGMPINMRLSPHPELSLPKLVILVGHRMRSTTVPGWNILKSAAILKHQHPVMTYSTKGGEAWSVTHNLVMVKNGYIWLPDCKQLRMVARQTSW